MRRLNSRPTTLPTSILFDSGFFLTRDPEIETFIRMRIKCIYFNGLKETHEIGAVNRYREYRPERTRPCLVAPTPVISQTSITLKKKRKSRSQPDGENAFARASGGGDGTAVEPSLGFSPQNQKTSLNFEAVSHRSSPDNPVSVASELSSRISQSQNPPSMLISTEN